MKKSRQGERKEASDARDYREKGREPGYARQKEKRISMEIEAMNNTKKKRPREVEESEREN